MLFAYRSTIEIDMVVNQEYSMCRSIYVHNIRIRGEVGVSILRQHKSACQHSLFIS